MREFHFDAFKDYCAGLSHSEIAKKHGVKSGTISTWSHREGWKKRKAEKIMGKEKRLDSLEDTFFKTVADECMDIIRNL